MDFHEILDCLERSPVIAAAHDSLTDAISSPAEVIFYLKANIMTAKEQISDAHRAGKSVFVHIDLAEGIGKDRTGIEFLKFIGSDGIISTRGQLIRSAKDVGLVTVQRFFALDSQGISSMNESVSLSKPDMIEIMPGVIPKIISRVSKSDIPVIAGGLVEEKQEITEALKSGAVAVSTGSSKLWYK